MGLSLRRKKMAIFQVTKQTGASLLKKRTRWPAKRGIRRRNKIEEALFFFRRFVSKEEDKVAG